MSTQLTHREKPFRGSEMVVTREVSACYGFSEAFQHST